MHRSKRLLSILLTLAMVLGMLPGQAFAAGGDGGGATIPNGVNGYQATAWADENTSEGYETAFISPEGAAWDPIEIDGKNRSSALNGKIWADKSIEAQDTDGDQGIDRFGVTISALGQTYMTKGVTETAAGLDVVFVLDFSGSMDRDRVSGMTTAANNALKTLMANADNRAGIITFSGSSVGTQSGYNNFWPMDHYIAGSQGNFLTSSGQRVSTAEGVTNSSGVSVDKNQSANGGTPTQAGIYAAGEMLKKAVNLETGVADKNKPRIPVIILLSDGAPGIAKSGYTDLSGSTFHGRASNGSDDVEVAAYTILTANAVKAAVKAAYTKQYGEKYETYGIKGDSIAAFYTIGLGITDTEWTHFVMEPTADVAAKMDDKWSNNDDHAIVNGYDASSIFGTNHHDGALDIIERDNTYGSNYSYATKYFSGDATQLDNIFQEIMGQITVGGSIQIPTESVGDRTNLTFVEDIGEAFRMDPDFTLTVPTHTLNSAEGTVTEGQPRTYTLEPHSMDGTEKLEGQAAMNAVESGTGVLLKPTRVTVNGQTTDLDEGNAYDKAALEELEITLRKINSGARRLTMELPTKLMAYNVMVQRNEENHYFTSAPVQLSYGLKVKENVTAGDYLASVVSSSYVRLVNNSETNDDGTYKMPYYWEEKYWGAEGQKEQKKANTNVAGAADYVYQVQNTNNTVSIYLGNNARVKMTGKHLTFHLYWNDNNDQDGIRYKNMQLNLYREALTDNLSTPPDTAPTAPEKVATVPFGLANAVGDKEGNATDLWEYIFSDQPVYDESGNVYRYWLRLTIGDDQPEPGTSGYTAGIYSDPNHNKGHLIDGGKWMCFATDAGMLEDAKLCVELAHEPATLNYTVEKKWENADGKTLPTVTVQLMANGKRVVSTGTGADGAAQADEFVIANVEGTAQLTADNWSYTWNSLPAYRNGEKIVYQAVETEVTGGSEDLYYETAYGGPVENEGNITATITNTVVDTLPEKVSLDIVKDWDDSNNQDGLRPTEITLNLVATVDGQKLTAEQLSDLGVTSTTMTMTAEKHQSKDHEFRWEATWENLPREYQSKTIAYSVEEGEIADYTSTVTPMGYRVYVTNTHTPKTRTITLTKTWEDDNNRDGIRPGAVTGGIYVRDEHTGTADYTAVAPFTIHADGTTTVQLPAKRNGVGAVYYIAEDAVKDYALTVSGANDANAEVGGNKLYQISGNSVTLTNTHKVYTGDYTVVVNWDDQDAPGNRPGTVKIELTDGEGKYPITLTVGENGKITGATATESLPNNATVEAKDGNLVITGLPLNKAKTEDQVDDLAVALDYSADAETPTGYTAAKTDVRGQTTFTFSKGAETGTLTLTKTWEDENNDQGKRPSVGQFVNDWLTLKAGETAVKDFSWTYSESGNTWTITFSGLPMYEGGQKIEYSVEETVLEDSGYEAQGETAVTFEDGAACLTNQYTADPEQYTAVTVTKVWSDNDNSAAKRPEIPGEGEADPLGMMLYVNGSGEGVAPDSIAVEQGNSNHWIYTWENVNKYVGGGLANYVVTETGKVEGYTTTQATVALLPDNEGNTLTGSITNTLGGDAVDTGTLTITKVWVDGVYTKTHDEELSFTVYGEVKGKSKVAYDVTMPVPDDGENWTVTVSDLPVYSLGQIVTYSVVENSVPTSYTVSYSDPVTLTKSGETGYTAEITVTNTYVPSSKLLTYKANGGTGEVPQPQVLAENEFEATVDAENLGSKLTYPGGIFLGWSTEELPLLEEEPADEDIYTTGEKLPITKDSTVLYAVWAKDENDNGEPDYNETAVTVDILWDDAMNQDGKRPDSVTVTLTGGETEDTVELHLGSGSPVLMDKDEDGNTIWRYTWTGLSKDETYTVSEDEVAEYTITNNDATTTGGTVTITNSYIPETTEHTVTKVWDHSEAPEGQQEVTGEATVELWANGQPMKGKGYTVILGKDNQNSYKWEGLPAYKQGVPVTYHAVETEAKSSLTTGSYSVAYEWTDAETTITNTYGDTRAVTVLYTWDDGEGKQRPDSITVGLFTKGENDEYVPVEGAGPLELTEDGGWTAYWDGLPINDDDPDNPQPITYYVMVTAVGGDGVSMTPDSNKLEGTEYTFGAITIGPNDGTVVMTSALDNPDKELTITKEWNAPANLALPEQVYVNVFGDDTLVASVKLTGNTWTETVSVPTYDANGGEITYTVEEIPVAGYEAEVTGDAEGGFTVTNTLEGWNPGTNTVTVTFQYENASAVDGNNQPITEGQAITLDYGASYTFTAQADAGYVLTTPSATAGRLVAEGNGQYTLSNITSNAVVTITGVKTGADTVTVTYVYNNPANDTEEMVLKKGQTASKNRLYPEDYDASGEYRFKGWYTDNNTFANRYDFAQPVDSDLTLYAKWEKNTPAADPALLVEKELVEVNGRRWKDDLVEVGDELTYRITVTNTGNVDLTDVEVTDNLPDYVTVVDTDPREDADGRDTLTWIIDLDVDEEYTIEVTLRVRDSAEGKALTNTAEAEWGDVYDSDRERVWVDDEDKTIVVPGHDDDDDDDREDNKPALNTQDHMAYIVGYEDGTVRPQNNITRAEVATIFFRLLTEESRGIYWSQTNPYSDVTGGAWYNNAVSTMANAGIIAGYSDGTFKPNAPITRAEFATIAARFSGQLAVGSGGFTDVSASHWAARYIATARDLGWIAGYPDGTFRPDQAITRAEAVTLINRMLERAVETPHMRANMVTWSDCAITAWYYEAIQEATNSHTYVRLPEIVPGQSFCYEHWQEVLPAPDWAALEKTWSSVN